MSTRNLGAPAINITPGIKTVHGSFTITASAISAVRPKRRGFTLIYKAAGVYLLVLDRPYLSVISADAQVGWDENKSSGAVAAAAHRGWISSNFQTTDANGANFAADPTNTTLVILSTGSSNTTLGDLAASERLRFTVQLAESTLT